MRNFITLPVEFFLTCLGLFLISGASSLLLYDHELVIHIAKYFISLKQIATDLTSIQTLSFSYDGKTYPLFPMFGDMFVYSFVILFTAFLVATIVSMLSSFILMLLPRSLHRILLKVIDLLDSLPDVLIVVFLQLFIIWLFKKTGLLLFDIYTLGEDRIYTLPIVCLAIMPIAFLIKNFLFQIRNEEEKPYVEFSFSKGFSKGYTLWVHLFRNVWVHFYFHIKPIFLIMLSNLLIIEILFNINGFMYTMLQAAQSKPSAFFIGLLMIYVPFFILFSIGRVLLFRWVGHEEGKA